MKGMLGPIVGTLIRHGGNAIGTLLVGTGLFTESQAGTVAGAAMIVATVVWSLINGVKKQ